MVPNFSNRFFCVALWLLVSVSGGIAQESNSSSTTSRPAALSAEQVLDRFVEATGGRASYQKLTSRMVRGTIELVGQGIKGEMEIWQKAPNKDRESITLPGFGTSTKGFDGVAGWSHDPVHGLRELSGGELTRMVRSAIFSSELRWREIYSRAELVGKEKVRGKEAYVVRLTPLEGSRVTEYYDIDNALLIRRDFIDDGPRGKVPVETYLSDYRETDGIKMPFSIQMESPDNRSLVKLTLVVHNLEISDLKFQRPPK